MSTHTGDASFMPRDSTVGHVRVALVVLLALVLAPAAAARPVEISGADPEAYTLDLRYKDRGAGVLSGSERIEFVNRGPAALSSLWLRLWANGPDNCRPRRIRVEVEAPATAGRERVRCTALELRLAAPCRRAAPARSQSGSRSACAPRRTASAAFATRCCSGT